MPGGERGVEVARIGDAEIGKARPDARLVHRAVSAIAAGQLDVRLEPGLDELGVGLPQPSPASTPT